MGTFVLRPSELEIVDSKPAISLLDGARAKAFNVPQIVPGDLDVAGCELAVPLLVFHQRLAR